MSELTEEIERQAVVPALVLDRASAAVPMVESLMAGGMTIVEVTLRTPAACKAIAAMRDVPGVRVGAGTVLSAEQLHVTHPIPANSQDVKGEYQ